MSHLIGSLLCLASMTGIGAVVGRWLRGDNQDEEGKTTFGWSFLFGAAVVGLGLHLPLAIDGQITHVSFAVVLAMGLVAWGWIGAVWWKHGGRPRPRGWMTDLPAIAGILLAIVLLPAVLNSARSQLSGYDARTIYGLKARILYDTGSVRGEDFRDVNRLNFNPGYPLLLPLLEAQMDWVAGSYEAPGIKFLFLGFALALVSIYAGRARKFEGPGFAATSALLLLLTPIVVCCFEGAGLSGSADLPLAALLFGGVLELSRWLECPSWRPALGAGLLLGAAALTKTEGALWVGVCGAAVLAVALFRRPSSWRRLVTVFPAVGLSLLALALGRAAHRGMPESPYYPSYTAALDWQWLKQLTDRPATVIVYVGEEFFRLRNWNLIWPCVLGPLFLLKRGRLSPEVWLWRFTAAGMACAYLAVLVLTPLHLHYQLLTTTTRLMLHIYPLAVLIMSEQLAASGWSRQFSDIFRLESPPVPSAETLPALIEQEQFKRSRAA